MVSVENICNLDVKAGNDGTNLKGKGGSRGTRAGRKMKVGRQARKDLLDISHTKRILAAKYEAKDLSRAKGTGMLLRTVIKECSVDQSEKGSHAVQSTSSKSEDCSKDSGRENGAYESYDGAKSTVNKLQNSMNMSKKVSLETNGRPKRGTRAGKHVKAKQNFQKVSMLLSALSEECWKV